MVIYNRFINYGISGINSGNSMLVLSKDNNVLLYK